MCSTLADRLARIERAIDELAAESGTGSSVDERLARLWEMLADLDPELSRRISGYRGTSTSTGDPGHD
jgi:phosphoserine phosphatase